MVNIANWGKRLLSLLISWMVGVSLFAYTFSGTTGQVRYSLDTETGLLHIYGSGSMGDYNGNWSYGYSGTAPWLNENAAGECLRTNIWGACTQYQRYNLRTSIKSVVIEDGVTSIGAAAFYNCTNLQQVEIPNSVTLVNYEAFRGCTSLEEVNIPASVTEINDRWATDCDNMKNVNVDPGNAKYVSINGIVYTKDMKTIVKMPDNNLVTDYSIPEGVTQMATDAIYRQRNVVNVVLPTTMTNIRYGVFDNCPNLTSFTLRNCTPPSLEKDFTGSPKLNTINVPCGCQTNFQGLQYWRNLTNLIQPKNVVVVNVRSNDPALGSVEVKMPSCSDRTVHLVANATDLGEFDYWSDEPNNHNFYRTFQAEQNRTYDVIAYFKPRKFQLQLVRCSPAADYVFSLKGDGQYAYGSNPQIECVINEPGWVFDSWRTCQDQNTVVSTQNPLTVDIQGYTCYCARIKRGKSLLTVQSSNTTMGTVTPNIKNQQYDYGTTLDISATPNEDYVFTGWSDGSTELERSITVTSDAVYTAYFKKKTYKITAVPNDAALGSCTGYGTFDKNATVTLTATASGCSRFVKWTDGEAEYTANPYQFTVKEAKDFVAVFESSIAPTEESVTVCGSYVWNGTEYTESGDYTKHFTTAAGCDSSATLHLTVNSAVINEISETACDSYTWDGTEYTVSGDYVKQYTTANGCDSTVTLHLTINKSVTNEISETACDSYTWDGTEYTETGDYIKHFTTVAGCDSAVTLHLTINKSVANEISETACVSYTWEGTEYTESGDYTKHLTTVAGCDSAVTLHLTITQSVTNEINETACDSYTWDGTEYTMSGDYVKQYTTANGCDSTVTLHLTINKSVTNEISETACDSYTWDGTEYTVSGDYIKHFTTVAGCDSAVTLHLTINQSVASEFSETTCVSYTWDGTEYTMSGDYVKQYTTATGCDSTVTLHLTINSSVTNELSETACDSYTWDGTEYTMSGDYVKQYTTANGCDSTVTLHLTVNKSVTNEISETACDSYTWEGTEYTASGDYIKHFTTVAGCDSTVTLHLTINHSAKMEIFEEACVSYTWDGVVYTASGDYTNHYLTAKGCDSTVTLHLTIVDAFAKEFSETACDRYTWDGTEYTVSGDYVKQYTTANGCDSTVTLHLTINKSVTNEISETACDTYIWKGTEYTESGDYIKHFTTVAGCDSAVTLHLTINHSAKTEFDEAACSSFVWDGTKYTESGDYTKVYTLANGCDSTVTMHLTINQPVTIELLETACDSITWDGTTFTESGDYTKRYQTVAGCDSTVIMHLTILHAVSNEITTSSCQSYIWDGTEYTETGDYTKRYTASNGCDSTVTLHLTIHTEPMGIRYDTLVVCGQTSYLFRGVNYPRGTHDITYNIPNGEEFCDSVVNFHLVVVPAASKPDPDVVYKWGCKGVRTTFGFTTSEPYTAFQWYIQGELQTEDPWVSTRVRSEFTGNDNYQYMLIRTTQDGYCPDTTLYICNSTHSIESGDVKPMILFAGEDCKATIRLRDYMPGFNDLCSVDYVDTVCGYNVNRLGEKMAGPDDYYTFVDGDSIYWRVGVVGHDGVSYAVSNPAFHQRVTVRDTTSPRIDALGISYQNRIKAVADSVVGDVTLTVPLTDVTDHISDNCDAVDDLTVKYSYDNLHYNDFAGIDVEMNVYTQPTKWVYYTISDRSGNETLDSVLYRIERKSWVGEDSFAVVRDTMVCPREMPYVWHGVQFSESGSSKVVGAAHLTLNVAEGYEKTDTVIVCESFVWRDGVEYTNSTQSPIFYVNNGPGECDSLIHLNLTVLNPSSGSDSIVVCVKELPYNWNGFSLTGDSVLALRDVYGCDSLVNVKVVILPIATETIYDTACVSYTLNDVVYTESGTYEQVLTSNVTGCDSILTLHLIINDVVKSEMKKTVCGSFTLNDVVYTETGVYTQQFISNVTGCDSILTLNLTVRPLSDGKDTIRVCEGELPIVWHNRVVEGDTLMTFVNQFGCDSVVDVKVIINHSVVMEITDTACGVYTLNGIEYAKSNDYIQRLTAQNGCDSIINLHLTILPPAPQTNLHESACGSYTLNDSVYTESGVYSQLLQTERGCDSIVMLYLEILPSLEYSFKDSTRGAYHWNDSVYTVSGQYQQKFQTKAGCDSVVTLDLKILEAPKVIVEDTVCSNEGLVWNGVLLKESGVYPKTETTVFGDDSTTILHLTVLPTSSYTIYDTAYVSYTLNDSVYTESGIYTQVLRGSNGCDSTLILNLKINAMPVGYLSYSGCGFIVVNDSVYTTSGRYEQHLKREDGLDSTLVMDLTIWPTYNNEVKDTSCGPYLWEGDLFTESGIYTKTFETARGCDSIVTVDLTVLDIPVTHIKDTACSSYTYNDSVYTKSGVYEHRFPMANGCDSVVQLELTILKAPITLIHDTVCISYKLNDSIYTESGVYDQLFQAQNGCDSIVRLNLVVLSSPTKIYYDTVCASYTLNGEVITESTVFDKRVDSPTGCDSIITVHLTILPVKYDTLYANSCGDYLINDSLYTKSGKYQQKLTSSLGCDSILTIYLNILEPTYGTDTVLLCENASYVLWHDYKVSSDTTLSIRNSMGCDSIVDISVVRLPVRRSEVSDTACAPYYWHGREYLTSGDFHFDTISSIGCDSIETLHLTILPTYEIFLQDSAVSFYEWNGVKYETTGTYTQKFTSALGCDSTVTIHLTILDPPADAPTKVSSCISYTWFGKTLTESGIYYEILKDVAGEDSIVSIDLTIHQPKVNPDTVYYTVCENELPVVWNGYEIRNEYSRVILQTVEGCDSFINFRLHILPTYDTLEYATACDSFTWHGKTYTRSGTYRDTMQSVYGCDSTFTLSLNLMHSSVTEISRTVCESELPVRWNEYEFYRDTIMVFPSHNGCDSIIKVDLTVNKEYNLVFDEVACGNFYWQGKLLTVSGTYVDSFTTMGGCDSIVTLNLVVSHPYYVELVDTTIAGTIYEKNGFTVDAQQIGDYEYEVMLKSVYGCDSLVHLSLFVDGRDINVKWTNVSGGVVDYLNGERWERKFCASDEYFANYKIQTGVPDSFKISFDHEGIAQGFKNVSGHLDNIDSVGHISFVVPDGVEPGTYKVFVQLFGEGKSSTLTSLKINMGMDYRRVTRMWGDVVVFDNSDREFIAYQWKKNNQDIPNATGQYYCEYDGLDGFYSLDAVTKDHDTLYVCGRYFEPQEVNFEISSYPVYTNSGKVTIYVKGLSEEEMQKARMYVYTTEGLLTYWTDVVSKETEVRVRAGRYICLVVLEDQRSASCRFVSHAVELGK